MEEAAESTTRHQHCKSIRDNASAGKHHQFTRLEGTKKSFVNDTISRKIIGKPSKCRCPISCVDGKQVDPIVAIACHLRYAQTLDIHSDAKAHMDSSFYLNTAKRRGYF